MERSTTYVATPPGATIKEQLEYRDMSQKEFAARMDMSEKHISKLINGEVQLTPETAVKLEWVLGVPAKFWNNLEAIYREKLAKAKAENAMEEDCKLIKQFPYSEMSKYGWVPATRKPKDRVAHLRKYFEVVALSCLNDEKIMKMACRRLAVTDKSDAALMAWSQEVKLIARDITVAPVNVNLLIKKIPEIRKMTLMDPDEFCPKLKNSLAECGIALVFLPHLGGSYLHGATFMEGKKIVIGLTTRGKEADRFWFSLFHELGHIVLDHICPNEETTQEDEQQADYWAGDMLIEVHAFESFKKSKDYSKDHVIQFAKEQGIAPGIVVGRMQRERLIKYSVLNDLKEHYEIAMG